MLVGEQKLEHFAMVEEGGILVDLFSGGKFAIVFIAPFQHVVYQRGKHSLR
jgi:hypothetical protein